MHERTLCQRTAFKLARRKLANLAGLPALHILSLSQTFRMHRSGAQEGKASVPRRQRVRAISTDNLYARSVNYDSYMTMKSCIFITRSPVKTQMFDDALCRCACE